MNKVVWKQTTSKKQKCKICDSYLQGKDGYIQFFLKYDYYAVDYNFCVSCLRKIIKNIPAKDIKQERYDQLIRRRMLNKLKG